MAVRSLGDNAYEMTADGDLLLDKIKVNSFGAFTTTDGGSVRAVGNVIKVHENGVIEHDETNAGVIWSSGAMNAGSMVESAVDIDTVYGIRAELPPGGRLVLYVE